MIKYIEQMHAKFGFHDISKNFTNQQYRDYLQLRLNMIKEEVEELEEAITDNDAEEVVDALIDIMVFTLGTLDIFQVDTDLAYNSVMEANCQKERGIKEGRPNPFGFPDLMKPEGWVSPTHENNHGLFGRIFND